MRKGGFVKLKPLMLRAGLSVFTLVFSLAYYYIPNFIYLEMQMRPRYFVTTFFPLLISPVLLFLVSYYVGKKIWLSSAIIPLFLGNLVGCIFLIYYAVLPELAKYPWELLFFYSAFLSTLKEFTPIFFVSCTAMYIGNLRGR